MKKFTPSPYQEAVFRFLETGVESGIVNAVAGSGKTTTIVEGLNYVGRDKQVLFLAFNKAIAEELKSRVPANVKAATFHSVGFGAWMRHVGRKRIDVDSNKLRALVKTELGERELSLYGAFVTKMVSLGKGMGIGYLIPDDNRGWAELSEHFDVHLESEHADERRALELCSQILRLSIADAEHTIDFDDMLYMPLIRNTRFYQYDLVFVDEAQDTNAVQSALLRRMLKPGGRLIAVGDPYQAIYGFRGADSEAMPKMQREFDCVELPLSMSYRCSKAVVMAAQEYVPHLEWWKDAAEGKVENVEKMDTALFQPTDAVLCRNTAPLVETAYWLIRNTVACTILGRDIGVGLENLIKKMSAKTIDGLLDKLDAFRGRETAKLVSKGREDKAQSIDDKVETLVILVENLPENKRTVAGLLDAIATLFSDNGKGILTLATVHKAKGLEWDRVFILGRHQLMPSKWARRSWQKEQEKNLIYVAYTRAKKELYFLPAPAKRR